MFKRIMSTKLFVGSLSWSATEDDLRQAFAEAGEVKDAKIIMDRIKDRSKGFGFVEMGSEEEAQKAIEMLNGKEIQGRSIVVNEARPMEQR